MPNPKDPAKLAAYREKQRSIALARGYGKWMAGQSPSEETKAKLSAAMRAQRNTPEWKAKLSETAKAGGYGLWMAGRPGTNPAGGAAHKGKTYAEIYGAERAEDEAKQRREANRARHPIGQRKADQRPRHNASFEYVEWRKAVFTRDAFTCQICRSHEPLVHAHHIKSWSKHPELRFDISNGVTLCLICHKDVHRAHSAA